ncbi:MAG: hypothetical protein RBS57_12480 [Desulforhabdus sp.]|nr:hypothetical protein [Desulforhabdus sp.]
MIGISLEHVKCIGLIPFLKLHGHYVLISRQELEDIYGCGVRNVIPHTRVGLMFGRIQNDPNKIAFGGLEKSNRCRVVSISPIPQGYGCRRIDQDSALVKRSANHGLEDAIWENLALTSSTDETGMI